MAYAIVVFGKELSVVGQQVQIHFNAAHAETQMQLIETLAAGGIRAIVIDAVNTGLDLDALQSVMTMDGLEDYPVTVLCEDSDLKQKLKAFDLGCDDLMDSSLLIDEICARINRSIFNRIANEQLTYRLVEATETAKNALVDNSDLGANIQFLLKVHDCDNLDQLGQHFFSIVERYKLSCSLQMRSEMGVKNMEAHGMAKDLESQLLTQLQDKGRYVDFGRRTVVNYDRVSLLIRNMPVAEAEKYGVIKDNTFCLLQGLNARIVSLEDQFKLQREHDAISQISRDAHQVMSTLKDSYQDVMKQILNDVENASEMIQSRVPHLALTEADERYLERITDTMVAQTSATFNQGLKVDELFMKLEKSIERSMRTSAEPAKASDSAAPPRPDDTNVIELF